MGEHLQPRFWWTIYARPPFPRSIFRNCTGAIQRPLCFCIQSASAENKTLQDAASTECQSLEQRVEYWSWIHHSSDLLTFLHYFGTATPLNLHQKNRAWQPERHKAAQNSINRESSAWGRHGKTDSGHFHSPFFPSGFKGDLNFWPIATWRGWMQMQEFPTCLISRVDL